MAKLGFIGTGRMGGPMAKRLLDVGHELVVFDPSDEAVRPLVDAGATRADTISDVGAACRVVFSSLPGPRQIEDVVLGSGGLCSTQRQGDVHVDLSTSSFELVRRIRDEQAKFGASLIDAPVSGGIPGAVDGTLTIMASGDQQAFDGVRPLFDAIAARVDYLGESGSGTMAKLINNAIFLCAGLIFQESMVVGAKAGLDTRRILEVLKSSSAGMYLGLAELFVGRDFDNAFFTLELAEKDVSLIVQSAKDLGVEAPVTKAAHDTYARAVEMGLGQKVFFATLRAIEEASGCEVPKPTPEEVS